MIIVNGSEMPLSYAKQSEKYDRELKNFHVIYIPHGFKYHRHEVWSYKTKKRNRNV